MKVELEFNKEEVIKTVTKHFEGRFAAGEALTKDIEAAIESIEEDDHIVVNYVINMIDSIFTEVERLSFGDAIQALKDGQRVTREGWNGKGMWLALSQGNPSLSAVNFWNPHNKAFAESNGGQAEVLSVITMKTADNKILMGWLASQTDMLAEDWIILD
jgi:hypothetical protein